MIPTIGIFSCGFSEGRQFVSQPYIHAVEYAGGFPVILPCTDTPPTASCLDFCHGFLLCGGDDVTPYLMQEEPSPLCGATDLKTDLFQLSAIKTILDLGKPILAICRGMQMLNVAMGGSTYQDASLYPGAHIGHMQHSLSRSDPSHRVTFSKGSLLYDIFGKSVLTNSFHHQFIKVLAPHLIPVGRTSDQVIEAVESDLSPFVAGVQWHPECMYDACPEMRSLFDCFLKAAERQA